MASVSVENLTVRFPIFDAASRSFKKVFVGAVTGGSIVFSDRGKETTYVEALNGISFSLESGRRLGVFGHNGSGKTTLLKVLAGIYPPVKGKVSIQGSIGSFVDIAAGVDGDLSGVDNILIRGLMMGRSKREVEDSYDSIIEFSGLGEFINMPIRTYSSGMWARLAFSVATAFHSEIILLDEWLSVGDEDFQQLAQRRLTSVVDNASILILASQSMDLLRSQCDEILILDHGKCSGKVQIG